MSRCSRLCAGGEGGQQIYHRGLKFFSALGAKGHTSAPGRGAYLRYHLRAVKGEGN